MLADAVDEDLRDSDLSRDLTPREIAIVLTALSDGLLQQQLLDPEAVRDLFGRVVSTLFAVGSR